jgi:hypothetical protein
MVKPTDDQIQNANGTTELPNTLYTNDGLKDLLTQAQEKINYIDLGPGTNFYKAKLMEGVQNDLIKQSTEILEHQLKYYIAIVRNLGDDVNPVAQFRFNNRFMTWGNKKEDKKEGSNIIEINGKAYIPKDISPFDKSNTQQ